MTFNMAMVMNIVRQIVTLGIDKSYYEGDYYEGKKHGKGKYIWPDGSQYEGDWEENKISG